MAIIFMDSFDHYSDLYTKWDSVLNAGLGSGRYGNAAYIYGYSGNPVGLRKSNLQPSSTGTLGFSFCASANGLRASNVICGVAESTTNHLYVAAESIYPDGFSVYLGTGAKIGSWSISVSRGVWYHIELTYTIADAPNGSFALRINGIVSCSGSGIDTRNGGSGVVNAIQLYANDLSGGDSTRYDDLYMATDAIHHGDLRVQYLAPSGAGIRTNFTPLSGSNWSNVDEATPADGDYNSSNIVGATDLFAMPDIGNGVVHGVQTVLRYKKDDAGFRTVQPVLYRADVDDGGLPPPSTTPRWYRGTKVPVYDTFAGSTQVLNTSPLSGLSWTKDEINALQFGYAVGDAAMFTIDAKLV